MVEAAQQSQKILNNRYVRLAEMESGSFATIYKASDSLAGQGVQGRFLSQAHCDMVQIVAKESPEIEFVRGDPEDFSEEKKQALEVLANLETVFPENARHAALTQTPAAVADASLVAVKKSKVNAFNDRDGILFYALREAQILQKLAG